MDTRIPNKASAHRISVINCGSLWYASPTGFELTIEVGERTRTRQDQYSSRTAAGAIFSQTVARVWVGTHCLGRISGELVAPVPPEVVQLFSGAMTVEENVYIRLPNYLDRAFAAMVGSAICEGGATVLVRQTERH